MAITEIIAELDVEIARLEQARKVLSNGSRLTGTGLAAINEAASAKKAVRKKKRTLSPEARQRMAESQRKRWEAIKKTAAK